MLTKKQSEHPQKVFQVFQVFRVFQVFHFAFGPPNRSFLVQIRTKPTNRYPPTSATKWMRKTPKKAIHPLVDEQDSVMCAIAAVFFRRSRLFLREAAFFSGGEGCEWRAQRATVGESGDKAENYFSDFIPLAVPRKGFSPHIPAPDFLFISIPQCPQCPQCPHPHQIPHPSTRLNLFNLLGLLGL